MTWCLPLCPSPPSLSLSPPSCLNWPCRWNEINNMSHNRSFFALELANREESVQFQTVSVRRRIAASQLSPNRRPLSRSASLINSSGIRQPASTKHLCLLRAWVGLLLALLGYVTYACLLKWHAVRCRANAGTFGDKWANSSPALIISSSAVTSSAFFSSAQEDMETSKYVCRMCLARLKFYKINKSSL